MPPPPPSFLVMIRSERKVRRLIRCPYRYFMGVVLQMNAVSIDDLIWDWRVDLFS